MWHRSHPFAAAARLLPAVCALWLGPRGAARADPVSQAPSLASGTTVSAASPSDGATTESSAKPGASAPASPGSDTSPAEPSTDESSASTPPTPASDAATAPGPSTPTRPTSAPTTQETARETPRPPSIPPSPRPDANLAIPLDGSTYTLQVRRLGVKVSELKERVRRRQSTISLLSESVLSAGRAQVALHFKNELSRVYRVTRALFVLDGVVQHEARSADGLFESHESFPIVVGAIPSGTHSLQVLLEVEGTGFGTFDYERGRKLQLRSHHEFELHAGQRFALDAEAWEREGAETNVAQRPRVRFSEPDPTKLRVVRARVGSDPGRLAQAPSLGELPDAPRGEATSLPRFPATQQAPYASPEAAGAHQEAERFRNFAVKSVTVRERPDGFNVRSVAQD